MTSHGHVWLLCLCLTATLAAMSGVNTRPSRHVNIDRLRYKGGRGHVARLLKEKQRYTASWEEERTELLSIIGTLVERVSDLDDAVRRLRHNNQGKHAANATYA